MREPPPIRTGELPKLIGHTPLEGEKMLGCELKKESRYLSLGTYAKRNRRRRQKLALEIGVCSLTLLLQLTLEKTQSPHP